METLVLPSSRVAPFPRAQASLGLTGRDSGHSPESHPLLLHHHVSSMETETGKYLLDYNPLFCYLLYYRSSEKYILQKKKKSEDRSAKFLAVFQHSLPTTAQDSVQAESLSKCFIENGH